MKNYTPDNWPAIAPPYHSKEGWEYEKVQKRRDLTTQLSTIPWLIDRHNDNAVILAARLAEIVGHPNAKLYRGLADILTAVNTVLKPYLNVEEVHV